MTVRPQLRLSVAPMMDRTDQHFRWLVRRISRHTRLYTEMVVARTMVAQGAGSTLRFDPSQHPIALQVGGSDPAVLARAAAMAEDLGFDEVNLNCGCPSSRVKSGRFGAVLMKEPALVAECVAAMRSATRVEVTVKCRIGVDELDRYEDMLDFVDTVSAAGCRRFIVHARKAWLAGLSPKENRTVPPLRYHDVARLAAERPGIAVELNGGVQTLAETREHLDTFAGVMIGRAAYDDPMLFASADRDLFCDVAAVPSRAEIAEALLEYASDHVAGGGSLHAVTRHALGLWRGVPGGRRARGQLTGGAGLDLGVLRSAVATLSRAARPENDSSSRLAV